MRTSRATLEHLVGRLNQELGRPAEPYTKDASGTYKANLGNLHLDSMNPGDGRTYALECLVNEGGGVSRPFGERRFKAAEMEIHLRALLAGIEAGRK